MNIKIVHIVFILVSSLFALFLGYWSYGAYGESGEKHYLGLTLFSVLLLVGLIVYGVSFIKKLKNLK